MSRQNIAEMNTEVKDLEVERQKRLEKRNF
jgi:hypothetical protein